MKKRLLGFLLVTMIVSACVGCGAESLSTDQTETTATTPEESVTEQTVENAVIPEKTEEPTPEKTSKEVADETEMTEETQKQTIEPEPTEIAPEKTTEPEPTEIAPEETSKPEETDESEESETAEQPPTPSASANGYDMGNGVLLSYGVLYVNACGNHLRGKDICAPSEGPFPYPMYTLIDNGDGSYTAYVVEDHIGLLDGNVINFDTSKTSAFRHEYWFDYDIQYAGGSSWTSCVGGYDEGCVHKLILYPNN